MIARVRLRRADRPATDDPKIYTRVPSEAIDDRRMTDAEFRILAHILDRIRGNGTACQVRQAEIAAALGYSVRTVRRAFGRLAELGLLAFRRDFSARGGPYLAERLFTYRAPAAAGFRLHALDGSDRTSGACPDRTSVSALDRTRETCPDRTSGAGPPIQDRQEDRETTTTVDFECHAAGPQPPAPGPSSSFPRSANPEGQPTIHPPQPFADPGPPRRDSLEHAEIARRLDAAGTPEERVAEERLQTTPAPTFEGLCATAAKAWPGDLIEPRVREMIREAGGPRYAALAIEYAVLRRSRGIVYALKTAGRWYGDGLSLADCRAEVEASRPRHRPAAMQNHNPPTPPPARDLSADEEAKNARGIELMRRIVAARGEQRAALQAELEALGREGKGPAAEPVARISPQPAGHPSPHEGRAVPESDGSSVSRSKPAARPAAATLPDAKDCSPD